MVVPMAMMRRDVMERLVDSGGGVGGDGVRLGMEFVIFDALDANRLKCPEADVQRDSAVSTPRLADAVEDFRGEVKAGGRGCY